METAQVLSDYERERGKPPPSRNHAMAQFNLIKAFFGHKDEILILPGLSLELDGRPFVPDISLYRRSGDNGGQNLDWQHDEVKVTAPPLTVVEILSPVQPQAVLMEKADAYLAAGVQSCWIVQPVIEAITVVTPGEKPKTYSAGEVADPATGVTVRIEEIFRPIR